MRIILLLSLMMLKINLNAQITIDSLSHINYQSLHGANLNDVFAYVDEFGNEYAIVGTSKGTSIVDVTLPSTPVEVFWLPGSESIWRDPVVFGNYAYITTEADDGLTIIDLTPLPASTILNSAQYTGPISNPWTSAHTCIADENGVVYVFGANRGNGGAIFLDVVTDPMNPIELGEFDSWYVHDGFARNNILYMAHIDDGFVSMADVTDKSNPVLLGTKSTPNAFSHSFVPSDDGNFGYTTDEVSGAYIAVYDISDPTNIIEVDRTQNSPGQGVIPHNVNVLGDYLVTSYYSDGVVFHDASYPDNVIKIGAFDTYPGQTAEYDGCWGVYAFLPSGNMFGSDITEGLFIFKPSLSKACYLEGIITDASTTGILDGVKVQIVTNDQFDVSKIDGSYATGIFTPGNYDVIYSKVGYYPDTLQVNLVQGLITIQDVQLVPIPPFNLTILTTEFGSGNPVDNVQIELKGSLITHTGITNGIGQEDFVMYYMEEYYLRTAKWGYITKCVNQFIDDNTLILNVVLEKGYHDEFSFDLGWTVSGTAESGIWERAIPFGSDGNTAPDIDAEFDCGDKAFVTGNAHSLNGDFDDVDLGYTLLVSPLMDLSSYSDPYLNFASWFFCNYGNPPDDTLNVYVNNGTSNVLVHQVLPDLTNYSEWIPRSIRLNDFTSISSTMQVQFRISDLNPNINITEAGIDYFYVSNSNVLSLPEDEKSEFTAYPNPSHSEIMIKGVKTGEILLLKTIDGSILQALRVENTPCLINLNNYSKGIYLIQSDEKVIKVIKD